MDEQKEVKETVKPDIKDYFFFLGEAKLKDTAQRNGVEINFDKLPFKVDKIKSLHVVKVQGVANKIRMFIELKEKTADVIKAKEVEENGASNSKS